MAVERQKRCLDSSHWRSNCAKARQRSADCESGNSHADRASKSGRSAGRIWRQEEARFDQSFIAGEIGPKRCDHSPRWTECQAYATQYARKEAARIQTWTTQCKIGKWRITCGAAAVARSQ